MRWRGQRLSVLVLCVLIGGLLLDSASAYAYLSSSVGYDVSLSAVHQLIEPGGRTELRGERDLLGATAELNCWLCRRLA